MLFIRLIRLKSPYDKEQKAWFDKKHDEALAWGVKFTRTYFTLGKYDVVSIIEAPDEKAAMRYAMATSEVASSTTLVAVGKEEVDTWLS
ncbi:MAG: GYD domain-containing protein [Nitrososphaerota archaeon]|nr:GYD domain-containing protein [Nitrososphaerota archaeon]MDG7026487.1 GYD domain-containing protein [Nitrososphaerota archaeon]